MVSIKGLFEDTIEKVNEGAKQQVKTVAQSATGQVSGNTSQQASSGHGTNEAGQASPNQQAASDQATKDMVNDFYAPSKQQGGEKKEPSEFLKKQLASGKSLEEAAKLEGLRNKLHREYYEKLTQRKSHEQEVSEEEQKKEEQKMEDLQKDDEKKKKDQPIAVQMGANRAERFPGASG